MITIWVPKRLVEIDLYNVAARSPQALADLSEQSYAQRVDYAAQKVHQRPLHCKGSAKARDPGAGGQSG